MLKLFHFRRLRIKLFLCLLPGAGPPPQGGFDNPNLNQTGQCNAPGNAIIILLSSQFSHAQCWFSLQGPRSSTWIIKKNMLKSMLINKYFKTWPSWLIIRFWCYWIQWEVIIPPAQRSCWGGILVSLRPSVRPSVCPSVRPSVRPSVPHAVSALYHLQLWMDSFHIRHKWSLPWEGVSRTMTFDLDLYLQGHLALT